MVMFNSYVNVYQRVHLSSNHQSIINLWFPQSSPIYDWCLVTWGNPGACAGHPPLNCFSLKNLSEIRGAALGNLQTWTYPMGNAWEMLGKWRSMEVNWPGVYHPKKYWPYRPHQDSRNSPRSDTHQIILIESLWSTSNHLLDSFFFGGNPHIYPLGSHGWEVQHGMIMQGVSLTKTWHGHSCHFHARELFEKKTALKPPISNA